jgi:hypothetical protein
MKPQSKRAEASATVSREGLAPGFCVNQSPKPIPARRPLRETASSHHIRPSRPYGYFPFLGRHRATVYQIWQQTSVKDWIMTATTGPEAHHAAAAQHHEQAARFHREASRHYQIGKDYAHAAHEALSAHGHALLALQQGNAASDWYGPQSGKKLPRMHHSASTETASTEIDRPIPLSFTARHLVAADHHQAAQQHHGQAETHASAEHYVRAAHETRTALDHAKHALFHGDEAAMHHTAHYGSHPSAELT